MPSSIVASRPGRPRWETLGVTVPVVMVAPESRETLELHIDARWPADADSRVLLPESLVGSEALAANARPPHGLSLRLREDTPFECYLQSPISCFSEGDQP